MGLLFNQLFLEILDHIVTRFEFHSNHNNNIK